MIMRHCFGFRFILSLVAACSILLAAKSTMAGLRVGLSSQATEYFLGVPVRLTVSFTNASGSPINTHALLHPACGNLILSISNDGKTFRKYVGPGWSTIDVIPRPKRLTPGDHEESIFSVLWNKQIAGVLDHILTEFAFPEPGHYWLKVSLLDQDHSLDSDTLEISILEPSGDDAVIWRILQDTPQLAFFIQYQKAPLHPEHAGQLEFLLKKYPNSAYAPFIKEALEVFSGSGAQSPSKPSEQETPAEGEVPDDAVSVIYKYLECYEKLDVINIADLLADGFLYNETLDKDAFMVEIKEDFEKLWNLGGIFRIDREIKGLEMIKGRPAVELELSFSLGGDIVQPPKRVRIGLVQIEGAWLIESWKEL